jgi:hypothetical protein
MFQNNTSTLQSQCDISQPSSGGQPNAPDNMHCGEHSQISCIQVVQNNTSTLQPQCDTCGVAVDHYDASTSHRYSNPTFSMPPHSVPVAVQLTPNVPPPISLQNRTYQESEVFTKELNKLKAQVSQLQLELNNLYQLPGIHLNSDTCHVYLRIGNRLPQSLCKSNLSKILRCKVLKYEIKRRKLHFVCQVTIPKSNLHQALTAAQRDKGIYAQLWRPQCSQPPNIQQVTTKGV